MSLPKWSEMNINQKMGLEIGVIVVISGLLGWWIYEVDETATALDAKIKGELMPLRDDYRRKVSLVAKEEAKKAELSVRKNELEVAVPETGSQDPTDLMSIVDSIKRSVESGDKEAAPLAMVTAGTIKKNDDEGGKKKRKDKKSDKPYEAISIGLNLRGTHLGLLRFIDLLEKDQQLFRLKTLTTDLSETKMADLPPEKGPGSPIANPRYAICSLDIETYNIEPEAGNEKPKP
ncbi:MAG: hypothetical protein AB7F75_11055 [Planctomycetota bacterium]